jgi:hypothetical protein
VSPVDSGQIDKSILIYSTDRLKNEENIGT